MKEFKWKKSLWSSLLVTFCSEVTLCVASMSSMAYVSLPLTPASESLATSVRRRGGWIVV